MKTKTLNNTTCFRRLKTGLIMAALLPATAGLLRAQTTSAYTNVTANLQWGSGINWNPNGIPNGTDAVVNLNGTTLYCSNTVENIALSNSITGPNYPFVFGTLNTAGTVGANTVGNQLRAAVSTGVPVINGNGIIYTRISGSQGIIYQNANAAPLLEYRYNTMSNYLTGNTEIAGGAVVEINGDYQFGTATNAVIVHDGGALINRSSDNSGNLAIPAWRKILLDAPSQYATFGTYSTYRLTFLDPIGEITPGSGFQMAKIAVSSTYSAGPLVFAATNTYTGPTVLSYGSLTLSNQFACMNSTLTPNTGGTLLFDKGIAANAFTVGGLAGNGYLVLSNTTSPGAPIVLTVGGNNASTTYSGRLLGLSSGGTLVKVGTGTLTLSGTADNSYVALNVSNGVVVLGKTSTASVHAVGGGVTLNGGTVQLNGLGIDQIYNPNLVTLNSGTFDLNGQTETIGGLAGNGGTNADTFGGATLTVNVASGAAVTNGSTITGGNLVFGGPGTQAFTGSDIRDVLYPGLTTTVTGGTLQLGNGGALIPFGGATGLTVNSPGTLSCVFAGTANFTNNISGTGNVAQNSSGTLILSGSDTHTGNTLVNFGKLQLPAGANTIGGSVIIVATNATLDVSPGALTLSYGQTLNGKGTVNGSYTVAGGATNAGSLLLNGTVTLQAGAVLNPGSTTGAGTINLTGNVVSGGYTLLAYLVGTNTPGGGTNSLLNISGNLDVGSAAAGTAANVVIVGAPANGTYVLANYGSFGGKLADVTVTGVSGRQTYTLQTVANQLRLVVSGELAQALVWRGDGSANVWDANNSSNPDWFNTASNALDYFGTDDSVTFDNSSANLTVNLTGDLVPQPGSVVTVNSTNNYTFAGSGYLDGSVSLAKTNSGSLTIDTANTFTGPVNLNGGVVSVAAVAANGAASPLGAGNTLAFNGGTLQYTGPNANGSVFNRTVSIGANGATVDQSGSGYLYISGLISGSGTLTKTGLSQLVISGNNTGFTNLTYVNSGQLQLRNVNGLGGGSASVIVTNTGASVAAGGALTGTIAKTFTLAGDGDGNGALQMNDSGTAPTFAGAINLATNASLGGNASGTVSGVISGAGTLTKLGTGTIILTANELNTGGTVINTGTLQLGNGAGTNGWIAPLPTGWALTNNGILVINHTNSVALTNTVTGTGWLNDTGSGLLILGVSNDFSGGGIINFPAMGYSFTTSVEVSGAGTLLVTNSNALGVGVVSGATSGGKLQLSGNISIPCPMVIYSTTTTNLENVSGTNSLLGQINGAYGNGAWPITSSGGLLLVSAFNNAVANATYGRTLQLSGTANGIITNIIDSSSALLGQTGNYLQMEKDGAGIWTIAGAADVPRGLTVNAGTLVIGTGGSVNNGGSSLLMSCTVAGGSLIVNGSLTPSPSVAVNVNGGQLGGNGTISGAVNVQGGGTLAPTAGFSTNTSALSVTGDLNLMGNGLFAVNKALAQPNDAVTVGGAIYNTGNGTITVTNNGPALVAGDTFTLFNQSVSNGVSLNLNRIVRGTQAQYVTWTNKLGVNGSITVLTAAPLGTNANLVSLALNPADSLTPVFATNVYVYYATNAAGVSPTVTVTNADLTASNALIVNGVFVGALASGVPSTPLAGLGAGSTNVLKVLVTAQDTVTTNLFTVNLTQITVSTNPFKLASSVFGNNLNLTWPADHLGWRLQVQTNSLNSGLGTNWFTWPNSTSVTNVTIPINPANPTVFLRMIYP